ncbi:hypothetical protein Tco_1452054, partial [Tanacetum coccineum]
MVTGWWRWFRYGSSGDDGDDNEGGVMVGCGGEAAGGEGNDAWQRV